MPITFDCPECGKACRAPAEMAGRKAKCQDCKAIITVPDEEEKVAEKPLPKRKAVPAVADDADEEKPRAKKSRKDDDEEEEKPRAKKSRKDDDDDEEDKPRKKKARKDDDDEDEEDSPRAKKSRKDDDEEEDDDSPAAKKKRKYHDVDDSPRKKAKPKRRKSGSGMGMVLMLGGGALALLVVCGGGFGILAWSLGWIGSASEMAFAPDGCTHVQIIHVSQIEGSGAYQTITRDAPLLKQKFAAPGNNDAITQAGVDSMFTAGSDSGDIIVIKTKKSISQADLTKGKSLKETKVGKYTMLEGPGEALCVADSSTVVFSHKPELLKKVLERGKAPELSAGMKKALGYTDLSKSMAFANDHKGGVMRAAGGGLGGMGGGLATGSEVECSGGYEQYDTDIRVSQTFLCKDGPSAEAAKKKQDDNMEFVKKLSGGNGNADNPMLEMAQAMHVTVSGSEVRIEGTIKADLIARMMKAFGAGPGPGGGGPGGKPR
jgi:hypothetical protein